MRFKKLKETHEQLRKSEDILENEINRLKKSWISKKVNDD
jgi:hypothetical protein